MIMAMIIFMRSAGINGITQIPRAALKSGICNDAEPYSSEKIAYNCSCDHTNELDQRFMAVVNYQSGNNSHNDKADDVSACRPASLQGRR
mgnify:CR=1 FL=1